MLVANIVFLYKLHRCKYPVYACECLICDFSHVTPGFLHYISRGISTSGPNNPPTSQISSEQSQAFPSQTNSGLWSSSTGRALLALEKTASQAILPVLSTSLSSPCLHPVHRRSTHRRSSIHHHTTLVAQISIQHLL